MKKRASSLALLEKWASVNEAKKDNLKITKYLNLKLISTKWVEISVSQYMFSTLKASRYCIQSAHIMKGNCIAAVLWNSYRKQEDKKYLFKIFDLLTDNWIDFIFLILVCVVLNIIAQYHYQISEIYKKL